MESQTCDGRVVGIKWPQPAGTWVMMNSWQNAHSLLNDFAGQEILSIELFQAPFLLMKRSWRKGLQKQKKAVKSQLLQKHPGNQSLLNLEGQDTRGQGNLTSHKPQPAQHPRPALSLLDPLPCVYKFVMQLHCLPLCYTKLQHLAKSACPAQPPSTPLLQ